MRSTFPIVAGLSIALFSGGRATAQAEEAHAEAPPGQGATAEAEHGEHTIHGQPPGSFFGQGTEFLYVSPELFFWTLVVFLPTALLLRKYAWEPILAALDAREQTVADGLAQAELVRKQAEELLREHEREMARAHEEARQILDEARAQAGRESDEALAEAREAAAQAQEEAAREVEAAKQEALGELKRSSVDLAAQIATKAIERPVGPDAYRRLAEEAT